MYVALYRLYHAKGEESQQISLMEEPGIDLDSRIDGRISTTVGI